MNLSMSAMVASIRHQALTLSQARPPVPAFYSAHVPVPVPVPSPQISAESPSNPMLFICVPAGGGDRPLHHRQL